MNRLPPQIPTGSPLAAAPVGPVGVPVDAAGNSLIPELAGRGPTPHEQALIAGEPIYLGSSNVSNVLWQWETRALFVEFLDGSIYRYADVPLAVAAGFLSTDSPGRYVWNVIRRDGYAYQRMVKGSMPRRKSQVIRALPG